MWGAILGRVPLDILSDRVTFEKRAEGNEEIATQICGGTEFSGNKRKALRPELHVSEEECGSQCPCRTVRGEDV